MRSTLEASSLSKISSKEQQRSYSGGAVEEVILGQAQGYGEGLALSLRAGAAHRHAVKIHADVVAVDTYGGMFHYLVMAASLVEEESAG